MGLDIAIYSYSGGFRAGSYSGFNRFRELLAQEEGINLGEMEGFGGDKSWDDVESKIVPLLNHSDCDGELRSYEIEGMAQRLKEIQEKWEASKNEEKNEWAEAVGMWVDACEQIEYDGGMLVFC